MTQSGQEGYAIFATRERPSFFPAGSPRHSMPASLHGAFVALACLAFGGPAHAADAFSTDWAMSPKSEARLVAAGGRLAGFEIKLAPGALTYWRDPGDSGVPPTFDFAGSVNIAKVEPVFPAPKRIKEADGGEALGYEGGVVVPMRVEPVDSAKPVTLALHASYAVCEKVCLPAEARLKLTLPEAVGSPYAGGVDAALSAAPTPVQPEEFGKLGADGSDGWRLCPTSDGQAARDLFVEPPPGWWVTGAPAPDGEGKCFRLTLREKPKDAAFPVSLRLTMTGAAHPVETTVAAPAP